MKAWMKRLAAALAVAGVAGAFFGLPTEWLCDIQPAATLPFLIVLLLAPVVGRLFCECLCPLGALQSLANWMFHPKSQVRRVCTRLPSGRTQWIVRLAVLAAFAALVFAGYGAVAWMATPYSIFGKALTLFVPGVALFAAVIALSAAGKGRFWCNWICPAGTLFTMLSRNAIFVHKVEKRCANCRACFPKPKAQSAQGGEKTSGGAGPAVDGDGVTRRDTLKGFAVLAAADAAEKTVDGGFADVTPPGDPGRETPVLPPGAVSRREFDAKCVGCGLCIAKCPSGCLAPSTELKRFGQPEMRFSHGYCRLACGAKCAKACPAGALVAPAAERRFVHMGFASWDDTRCLRTTEGVECSACRRKCPVKAIHLVDGRLVVDRDKCVGCGACEHVCPARPLPAMTVTGLERQRIVGPAGEADLVSEMVRLVRDGESCVAARDGVICARAKGRGIMPVLELLDAGKLSGAVVVDKVVGRAAAAVCIVGGARRVHALVAGADAAAMFKSAGIEFSADETVPRILNRDMTDGCPMERAVEGLSDPAEMVKALR